MSWAPEVLYGASRIGLGLAALGRPAYITTARERELGSDRSIEAMRARTHTVLDAAYDGGVRYVDAARSYGLAESFLSDWLRDRHMARRDVVVGSKWGYTYVGDWRIAAQPQEVQDLSLAALRRQEAESRALLDGYLSLYQIHSATEENGVLRSAEVIEALTQLRANSLAIGVTVTGPYQARVIDQALELELFDAVQATWNLLEPSSGAALERAHSAGLTVIVKEPLANGRLTANGDQPVLLEAAAARGVAADTLSIAAVLAQPWADIVLSGAVTVRALRSNLAATPELWDAELGELTNRLRKPPIDYWRERSQRPWS